jgi:hypothetical protein
MIYIPSCIKTGSGTQKVGKRTDTRLEGDFIGLLLFFQDKESSLKMTIGLLSGCSWIKRILGLAPYVDSHRYNLKPQPLNKLNIRTSRNVTHVIQSKKN